MATIGERIRKARMHAGKTLAAIGAACGGKTPQAVKNWEYGNSVPSAADLSTIADLTGVSLPWLLYGVAEQSENVNLPGVVQVGRVVPSIDWKDIVRYQSGDASAISGHVRSHFPCGARSFRTTVPDKANEPELLLGDSVIVDPDRRPKPGDFCLAIVNGEHFIRKLRDRQTYVELIPANLDWPVIEAPPVHESVVGVITEFSRQKG